MYNTDCKHKNKKQTKCKGRIDGGGGIATAAMRILEIRGVVNLEFSSQYINFNYTYK